MDVWKSLLTFSEWLIFFRNTQDRDYSGLHTWLSTQDLCGGFHLRVILVLLSNYPWLHTLQVCGGFHMGVILTFKSFSKIKKFWFENNRIKFDLCNSTKSSTSQKLHNSHQICVICQYIIVLTPIYGAAYSNVQVLLRRSKLIGSRVYIPTWLPVAHGEDGG
jgi:hypothetical protein